MTMTSNIGRGMRLVNNTVKKLTRVRTWRRERSAQAIIR